MPIASHGEPDSVSGQPLAMVLLMAETIERLVATLEQELDSDSNEGAEPTGSAWIESCDKILACASESRRVLDRPEVVAALSLGAV